MKYAQKPKPNSHNFWCDRYHAYKQSRMATIMAPDMNTGLKLASSKDGFM
jgi:hypothetical protein